MAFTCMAFNKAGTAAALAAVVAGAGVGITIFGAPSAMAAPDPCAASTIARTVGSVGTNTGVYLDAHPDTNAALTSIAGQPAGPQSIAALKLYFDANPQAAKDLQAIQQPLTGLTTKCKLPISLPQVLGLMQAAQENGLPSALPAAATAAQAVSVTQGAVAGSGQTVPTPKVAAPAGSGPLPGPGAR